MGLAPTLWRLQVHMAASVSHRYSAVTADKVDILALQSYNPAAPNLHYKAAVHYWRRRKDPPETTQGRTLRLSEGSEIARTFIDCLAADSTIGSGKLRLNPQIQCQIQCHGAMSHHPGATALY